MNENKEDKILILNNNDILPNRFQPRKKFDEKNILELTESIKEHGIFQPIIVRPLGDKYELVAGERRYKANVLAGNETIPVIVKDLSDAECSEIAITENVQRKDLSPLEEALSYKRIIDMGYLTQQKLAEKLGKSQSYIANKVRLLKLTDEVQDALLNEKISERHARSLLRLNSLQQQNDMLNRIITERLTVRKTDEEIDKMNNSNNTDNLETTPISTIFENNKLSDNQVDDNDVFKFGPDIQGSNNLSSQSTLMSFDANDNEVSNVDNQNNEELRGNIDNMIQNDEQDNIFGTFNNVQPTDILKMGKMIEQEEQSQSNVQPESITVSGINDFKETESFGTLQQPNMAFTTFEEDNNGIDLSKSQVVSQPEVFNTSGNGNLAESIPNIATELQSNSKGEPFAMFGSDVNQAPLNAESISQSDTMPMFASAQPTEIPSFGTVQTQDEQPGPFAMFGSNVNSVQNNINNVEQPGVMTMFNNVQPTEMPIQPEPFAMFGSNVNSMQNNTNNVEQPGIMTMFNNVQPTEMPSFGTVQTQEETQQVNVQPEPFVVNNNDTPEEFTLNQSQNISSANEQNKFNSEIIPSTPIFEKNQSEDTISEFKKPEPIIVTDYNKQYDPVMPDQKDKTPDIDFKTIINLIRQCSETIEKCGYKIDTEEYDLENMYQVVFKIDKI